LGIAYVVHRLNPEIVARVAAVLSPEDCSSEQARAVLAQFGKNLPSSVELDSWHELSELDGRDRALVVLCGCASVRQWDLDKSVDRPAGGLAAMVQREQSLRTALGIFRPGVSPNGMPLWAVGDDSGAFIRVVPQEELRHINRALEPFSGALGRSRILSLRPPLAKRIFGDKEFQAAWAQSDYLWNAWQQFLEAVRTSAEAGHWLAVSAG
jgi:hypothetical protein